MYNELFEDFDKRKPTHRKPAGMNMGGFGSRLSASKEFNTAFKRLIDKLTRLYPIDKASLTLHDKYTGRLRVTHMYEHGSLKTGLFLNFPAAESVMYQVLMQGYPVVDNYPDRISVRIIEKKILLSRTTRSVLIVPLLLDSAKVGLLSLASSVEHAFGLYLEGVGEALIEEFIGVLSGALEPVNDVV